MNVNVSKIFRNKYMRIATMIVVIAVVSIVVMAVSKADETIGVKYRAHIAYNGWLDWKTDGQTAGTTGESKRMEAIKIKLTGDMAGDVIYSTYVRDAGWQNEVRNSETSGVEGQSKQIEAIKIRLEGEIANAYDIAYRVHIKNGGWQGWVTNGTMAGSDTYKLRIEAIEIKLVQKGDETGIANEGQDAIVEEQQQEEQPQQQEEQPQVQEEQPQVQEEQPQVQEEQPQAQEEQPQVQQEQPQQEQTQVQESPFHKYTDLTDAQLRGLAGVAQREQGTARGAAAEASLMANHLEMRILKAKNYEVNGTGLYKYVRNSGWFAHAASHMDNTNVESSILEAVRKVLVEGKRTLPGYVDEHDCFSDISSATNDGVAIKKRDRSAYVQNKTICKNVYGSKYTFYCFPSSTSDPFGYTSESKRAEIGDFCYSFDDI